MPTKVLDLELSEEIRPIWGTERYDRVQVLARYHRRPVSWMSVSNNQWQPVVSAEQLRQAIGEQVSWPLWQRLLREGIGDGDAKPRRCLRSVWSSARGTARANSPTASRPYSRSTIRL